MGKRVFIIHGWGGTAGSGWKGWLQGKLEKEGFRVFSPQMPDAKSPKMERWLGVLSRLVGKPDTDTYLVGHSLGTVAVMRYLERLKKGEQVGGAVLVAGFSDDLGMKELEDFFPKPLDFAKIRGACGKFAAIHSTNDKYVALKYGDILKEKLGARLIVLKNMGHFSHSEGINELPQALEAALEMAR